MILTAGDALGDLVAEQGLGITVRAGDVDAIARSLTRLLTDGLPAADFGPMLERFQWPAVARPLLRWLERPRRAADVRVLDVPAADVRGPGAP